MKNIFAYTETLQATPGYVGYASLNERDEGRVFFTVRSRYAHTGSEIELGDDELEALARGIAAYLREKRAAAATVRIA